MDVEKIKDTIGSLLGQSGRLVGNHFDTNLRKAGLDITVEQWVILLNLYETDGLSQKALADKVHKNKSSINSVLNHLEQKGYIQRHTQTTDKRVNIIRLTPEGEELKISLFAVAQLTTEQFTRGISDADISLCSRVLRQIIKNVQNQLV